MCLIWIKADQFVSIRDTDEQVSGGHLRLVPSVTTAPEVGPRLHLRELRDRFQGVDPFHPTPPRAA